MTVDDRLVIDLADVLAVQCECRKCKTSITYTLAAWEPREMICPSCRATWWVNENPGLLDLQRFAANWRSILERQAKAVGEDRSTNVSIRLQIPRPAR